MIYVSEYADDVQQAIDAVIDAAKLKNRTTLARRLDVSKQALSKWAKTGLVPAHRALQMELMTDGEVSWRSLCPDIVVEFNNSEGVVYEISRKS